MRMPTLFVSHGAPTFALAPGRAGQLLRELGQRLPRPTGVLVVSPHWTTPTLRVMHAAAPRTLHDFSGFGAELEALQYPAAGSPPLAARVESLLQAAGIGTVADASRGYDHGAWVPLLHLYPEADVPVIQVSMPASLTTVGAWRLGEALSPLRDEGVLVVGSGSLTHNLFEVFSGAAVEGAYAAEFVAWARSAVTRRDRAALLDYRLLAPHAERAHPTEEHLLPLLVATGAGGAEGPVDVLDGGLTYGVLSMESYLFH